MLNLLIKVEMTRNEEKKKCKLCGRMQALINKYTLGLCRQCFRAFAREIGFKKYK
jgi:small subunit ribosomal protein S29e